MNREETRADNEMRQRWIDGEIAQFYTSMDTWEDCPEQDNVGWNNNYTHRIKPKPTTRPWTVEECPVGGVVRRKEGPKIKIMIVAAGFNGVCLGTDDYNTEMTTFKDLREDFTMLNGDPCGITESPE